MDLAGLNVTWHSDIHQWTKQEGTNNGTKAGSKKTIREWIYQGNPFTDKKVHNPKHTGERKDNKGRNQQSDYRVYKERRQMCEWLKSSVVDVHKQLTIWMKPTDSSECFNKPSSNLRCFVGCGVAGMATVGCLLFTVYC